MSNPEPVRRPEREPIDRFNLYLNVDNDGEVHGKKLAQEPDGDWTRASDTLALSEALTSICEERDAYHDDIEKAKTEIKTLRDENHRLDMDAETYKQRMDVLEGECKALTAGMPAGDGRRDRHHRGNV